jgi:hypothetical protein
MLCGQRKARFESAIESELGVAGRDTCEAEEIAQVNAMSKKVFSTK